MKEIALPRHSAAKMEVVSPQKAGFPLSCPTRRLQANPFSKEPSAECFEVASLGAANPGTASVRLISKVAFFGDSIRCDVRTRLPCSRRKPFFFSERCSPLHAMPKVRSNVNLRKTDDPHRFPTPDVPFSSPKVRRSSCRTPVKPSSTPTTG
jgi:hypothetical protein